MRGSAWPEATVPIECEPPLCWISPSAVASRARTPPRHRYLLRSREFVRRPHVEVVQDGRSLWAGRLPKLVPGRSAMLAWSWTESVDQAGGPVRVRLASHG